MASKKKKKDTFTVPDSPVRLIDDREVFRDREYVHTVSFDLVHVPIWQPFSKEQKQSMVSYICDTLHQRTTDWTFDRPFASHWLTCRLNIIFADEVDVNIIPREWFPIWPQDWIDEYRAAHPDEAPAEADPVEQGEQAPPTDEEDWNRLLEMSPTDEDAF